MRNVIAAILAAVVLMVLPTVVLAQEPAKYNLASAQGNKDIKVTPGGEGTGVIYFYNVDGNRISHISLEVSQAPSDWQVEIQPPVGEIQVEISNTIVTVIENLHVEPSELLLQEPESIPQGMVCITVSNRGYALARAANIIVRVPESEELGTSGNITVSAVAEWLGQRGAASIKQARDFDFSVEVVSETPGGDENIIGGDGTMAIIVRWLPAIVAAVIAVLAAVLIPRLVGKRRG